MKRRNGWSICHPFLHHRIIASNDRDTWRQGLGRRAQAQDFIVESVHRAGVEPEQAGCTLNEGLQNFRQGELLILSKVYSSK